MEKKTCAECGKIWILEKFDQHPCVALPKKARKVRAKETKTETKDAGTPSSQLNAIT
jgi:hypothetical protein